MTTGPALHGRPGTWVVGGIATALLMAWVLTGDACAARRARTDPEALELLRDSAAAARRTPYEGMQFRTTWHGESATTAVARVTHTPGGGAFVRMRGSAADGPAHPSRPSQPSELAQSEQPETTGVRGGLSGFTPAMLDLMAHNYAVVRGADDDICGRRAQVVEARRADGSAAGRFWIDAETGILLYRELIDPRGRPYSRAGFSDLRISRGNGTIRLSEPQAAPWTHRLGGAELAELREQGWPAPRSLPGKLSLHDARRATPAESETVHLSYSDGLAAVSVFIQRGRLDPARLSGWTRTKTGGRTVFVREARQRWAVWASRGYVYTVLTDAPEGTSESVVTALPHDDRGFWTRMGRGMSRLGSWANPWN